MRDFHQKHFFVLMIFLLLVVTGCSTSLNGIKVDQVKVYINIESEANTMVKEITGEKDEAGVLIKLVQQVKEQDKNIDLPPSDYQLVFSLENGETLTYSLWLDPEQGRGIVMGDTSHFAGISSSDVERVASIIND
ncbi:MULTISPECIES: hypothetical protein [Pontibacillus]|uniref:YhfM-like domain-containing protein n=1 Tax=Pontibacillus chungwhensis TaxID=265426 RepID=A0ABY8UTM3_9BACI|nr:MULTISPECIES: hypothetical protein [Pontibacillus]MCD5323297.1 hypothetical protein [Pontibacillus sp. HN14]WIF96680.1 hypothetical protein QNI29_13070 [Pontibacillus chungwhensis]